MLSLDGFSTPALLSTGENRPIPLFAYLLLLNLGLAWVARARAWPVLNRPEPGAHHALSVGMGLQVPRRGADDARRRDLPRLPRGVARRPGTRAPQRSGLAGDRKLQDTALFGAALPLLFTLYLAAVPGYGARFGILFGLLFLIDAGFSRSLARRDFLLHLAGGLGTLVA